MIFQKATASSHNNLKKKTVCFLGGFKYCLMHQDVFCPIPDSLWNAIMQTQIERVGANFIKRKSLLWRCCRWYRRIFTHLHNELIMFNLFRNIFEFKFRLWKVPGQVVSLLSTKFPNFIKRKSLLWWCCRWYRRIFTHLHNELIT